MASAEMRPALFQRVEIGDGMSALAFRLSHTLAKQIDWGPGLWFHFNTLPFVQNVGCHTPGRKFKIVQSNTAGLPAGFVYQKLSSKALLRQFNCMRLHNNVEDTHLFRGQNEILLVSEAGLKLYVSRSRVAAQFLAQHEIAMTWDDHAQRALFTDFGDDDDALGNVEDGKVHFHLIIVQSNLIEIYRSSGYAPAAK